MLDVILANQEFRVAKKKLINTGPVFLINLVGPADP